MYRLQEQDYKNLYPYFLPKQIKNEFGSRALHERSISSIYKKNFKTPAQQKYAAMIKETYAIADIDSNEVDWHNEVAETINNIRTKKKHELWAKINIIEELTGI